MCVCVYIQYVGTYLGIPLPVFFFGEGGGGGVGGLGKALMVQDVEGGGNGILCGTKWPEKSRQTHVVNQK